MSDLPQVQIDEDELVSTGLLSTYDRLRGRVTSWVERRAGRLGAGTAEALLLVPDIFILLARLSLDRSVPRQTRTMMAGALAYFLMPVDLLPEAFLGPGAFAEDLIVATAVLATAFGSELGPRAEKYWNGSQKLRVVLGDVSAAAHALLGPGLYDRVKLLLDKWGVDLEQPEHEQPEADDTVEG
ncbi:MAG: DUF1232 domain-containing protein [Acidobacteria bacterium]|nr:MAG: DUF1232 domain-containing protein [Acidobacteriota bacterium]